MNDTRSKCSCQKVGSWKLRDEGTLDRSLWAFEDGVQCFKGIGLLLDSTHIPNVFLAAQQRSVTFAHIICVIVAAGGMYASLFDEAFLTCEH